MPKKSKRKVSRAARGASVQQAVQTPAAESAKPRSSFSRRTTTAEEFNPDYTYVIKDLKRIGLLAGSFFIILIALSFIIH